MSAGIPTLGLPSLPETRGETDLRLFRAWKKASGMRKEDALAELLGNLQGAIMTAVNSFSGAPLPSITMKLEAQRYAKEALDDFDSSRGFGLASYVTTSVKQKLYRYVSSHQNVARIPQYQIDQIGPLREATADLTQKFGHEPSAAQLADHMGVPLAHVSRLRRTLRKDLLEEGGGVEEAGAIEHDADFEKAMLAYYSMSEVEKMVFDYTLGAHGQNVLSTNELAAKLKISAGRISQIKKRIAGKIAPYLGSTGVA